jgi:DNA-binding response OmpR family regulator
MQKYILVVDDDALMRRSVAFNLEQSGYLAKSAGSAEDALAVAQRDKPDLVLLDIGLPGMDGLDALRRFKDKLKVPVIFVTARRYEFDEVLGLELGADDYITKPFEMNVLLARIKAVLRRTMSDEHVSTENATIVGQPLELTKREFDILHTLMLHAGQVLSTQDLLANVWGAEYIGEPQVVYVHIRWLREKIEASPENPKRIVTVYGVGYKLVPKEA